MNTTTQIITPFLAMLEGHSKGAINNGYVIGHIHRRLAEIQLAKVSGITLKMLTDDAILDLLLCRAFGEQMSCCPAIDAGALKAETHGRPEVKRIALRYMLLGRKLATDLMDGDSWEEYLAIVEDANDTLKWAIQEKADTKAA